MAQNDSCDQVSSFVIRHCEGLDDLAQCVDLQKMIWGYADIDIVPLTSLVMASETGGHILGAFDNDKIVGFVLGYVGLRRAASYIHSQMLAVLPSYRDRGIGRQLKLRQRKECLRNGLDLIEWTFDPLDVKNARFNIGRLGAIVRRFLPNLYGVTSSHLHTSLPTDRLVAEWHLASPRVKSILAGHPPQQEARGLVSFPANIATIRTKDLAEARGIQDSLRSKLTDYLNFGYSVTGFKIEGSSAIYLLEEVSAPH
jgi:predicted GNAT superfamily acetyltransferase